MVDRHFSDADLAEPHDALCAEQRPDFDFYMAMVMAANAVLDAGCGTGARAVAAPVWQRFMQTALGPATPGR
jgi:hypothetical protein